MKSQILIAIMLLSTFAAQAHSSETNKQEYIQQWVHTYVQDADGKLLLEPKDMCLLLNTLYFSYQRSASMIQAQEQAVAALSANWKLWQNITQTRRNPSIQCPYIIDQEKYLQLMQSALHAQQNHNYFGTTYAHMLEIILKERTAGSDALVTTIKPVREQARLIVLESLANVQEHITAILQWAASKGNPIILDEFSGQRDLLQYLASYVPMVATYSFVAMDRTSITVSEECWETLLYMQELTNIIWKTIESSRSEWFHALYKSVYAVAQQQEFSAEYMCILFDQNGLIDQNNPQCMLLSEEPRLG